jgi:hypothetical protein
LCDKASSTPCADGRSCNADAEADAQASHRAKSKTLKDHVGLCSDTQLYCCPRKTLEECKAADAGEWCSGESKCKPEGSSCIELQSIILASIMCGFVVILLIAVACCYCRRTRKGSGFGASAEGRPDDDDDFLAYKIGGRFG